MSLQSVNKKCFLGIRLELWICLLLMTVLLILYGRMKHFEYIGFDDSLYIFENPHVQNGLNLEDIAWAFRFKDKDYLTYWHPLTWLSHMLDAQLFGLDPGWHHLSNLFLHFLSSVLLFWVLNRMTGALWRSAFVAAVFAVHPLNVESVAWVSERKNVLSTFFWMLTLLSYVYYVARPVGSRYLLTILIFMLGLMAKPMLVTLPGVMLLIDYWPLKRFGLRAAGGSMAGQPGGVNKAGVKKLNIIRVVFEKLPFLLLSTVSVYVSSSALQEFKTVLSTELVPMNLRIANALVSYVKYIFKMIWPQNLSIFYPYPRSIPAWQVTGAVLFLVGVTIAAVWSRKKRPYLLIGWLWYLGTLLPVIGIMQAGLWPALADRWAYIPLIGIFIMICWGIPGVLPKRRYKRAAMAVGSIATLIVLMSVTRIQLDYWQNSFTLFERAIAIDKNNKEVHMMLGVALEEKGRTTEAFHHYTEVLRIDPFYFDAHNYIGGLLGKKGRMKEAIVHFKKALQLNPDDPAAYFNLGNALAAQGNYSEAIDHYAEAIRLQPEFLEAYNNLGIALVSRGNINGAIRLYTEALKIDSADENILKNLKSLLAEQKKK